MVKLTSTFIAFAVTGAAALTLTVSYIANRNPVDLLFIFIFALFSLYFAYHWCRESGLF